MDIILGVTYYPKNRTNFTYIQPFVGTVAAFDLSEKTVTLQLIPKDGSTIPGQLTWECSLDTFEYFWSDTDQTQQSS